MFIAYIDKTLKTREVNEFSIKAGYVLVNKQFLLGEEGGWIHESQLVEEINIKETYDNNSLDNTRG